jgi:hypothetical protein
MLVLAMLSVQSVSAVSESVTITGTGKTLYINTDIMTVSLPTDNVWDFILDPQGLYGLTGSAYLDELHGGKIFTNPNVYSPAVRNSSSFPVTVSVAIQMTGNVTAVATESAVNSGTAHNALMWVASEEGDRGYVISASPQTVKYVLGAADYKATHLGGDNYAYVTVPNTEKSMSFQIGGLINKNADWSEFVAGDKTVGISAVFSFERATTGEVATLGENDVAFVSAVGMGVYQLPPTLKATVVLANNGRSLTITPEAFTFNTTAYTIKGVTLLNPTNVITGSGTITINNGNLVITSLTASLGDTNIINKGWIELTLESSELVIVIRRDSSGTQAGAVTKVTVTQK